MALGPRQIELRPLAEADLDEAVTLSARAFGRELSAPQDRRSWWERVAFAYREDPAGAWVAERSGQMVGVAQALVRERLWVLSLLTVVPGAQGSGAGGALLERTLAHGPAGADGLIASSDDKRALRLYALNGFALQPSLQAVGEVDRRALPALGGSVREGDAGSIEACEPISRAVRGASHSREIAFALQSGGRLLHAGARGFAVTFPGRVWLLCAFDEHAAGALLWHALGESGQIDGRPLRWLTAAQDWAVAIAVRAGLALETYGALCVRGEPGTLRPFIPSGPFA